VSADFSFGFAIDRQFVILFWNAPVGEHDTTIRIVKYWIVLLRNGVSQELAIEKASSRVSVWALRSSHATNTQLNNRMSTAIGASGSCDIRLRAAILR
jgi:hypothetical protein